MANLIKLTLKGDRVDLIVGLFQILNELRRIALGKACQGSAYVLKEIGLVALNCLAVRIEVDLVKVF